jgi:YD repeat-containing protein
VAPTTYVYDGVGRLQQVTNPDQTIVTYAYDQAGRQVTEVLADSSGAVVSDESAEYDADGNLVTGTSARGHDTAYVFDALGRMASCWSPPLRRPRLSRRPIGCM